MKYLKLFENQQKPTIKYYHNGRTYENNRLEYPLKGNEQKVIIRDEFIMDICHFVNAELMWKIIDIFDLTIGDNYTKQFKEKIARRKKVSKLLSQLTYIENGKEITFNFPTDQLISPENYVILKSAKQYNL